MTDVTARLAVVEKMSEATQQDIRNIYKLIGEASQTTNENAKQLAVLIAMNGQHNADTCPYRDEITGFRKAVGHDAETCPYQNEIKSCQQALWFAQGGGKVVVWLLGGGLLAIGALVGAILQR